MVAIAAALAAAGGAPFAAHAQDAGGSSARDADQAKTLEAVSVVGSRIRRQDETAASPVFTMERDEIEATGVISIGALLQELPSVGSSFNSTGSGCTRHGSSSLNLPTIGRASCRERVCQYVYISVGAVY